ncbi:MAG: hypothetical protein QOC92_4674 [Acidimicrobiaceae bacterium]|jgi:catechol-2,3-dioxygenase
MAVTRGLSHIAMGVPPGALSDEFRAEVQEFYGRLFGWTEIESLRLVDRLTLAIGGRCYVNLREIPDSMTTAGYEHFGVLVESVDELERVWNELDALDHSVDLTPIGGADGGVRTFRFRHLLPLSVEVQFFPA